jgi:hypothetical protein
MQLINRENLFGVERARVEGVWVHNQVLREEGRFKPKNKKLSCGSSFFAIREWGMWLINRESLFGVGRAGVEGVWVHNQVLCEGGRFKPKNRKLSHGSLFFMVGGWGMWLINRESLFWVEKAKVDGMRVHNQVLHKGGRFKPKNWKPNCGSSFFATRGRKMWLVNKESLFVVGKAKFERVWVHN